MSNWWFITGVARGIGRALGDAALARGDCVIGTARSSDQAEAFAGSCPGRSFGLVLDLDEHAGVAATVNQAVALSGGRIDTVVNNAGRSLWASIEETPIAEAQALFATNVFGPMAVMQAFLPHFRAAGGGTFINMSSGCGLFGVPGVGAYCGSKFALEGISETIAQEAAPFGVRMMLVEPGAVRTDFIKYGTREVGARGGHYADIDGGKDMLDDYYGQMAMRPEALAETIMTALNGDTLPLRLIVGDDTRPGARAKFQAMADMLAD